MLSKKHELDYHCRRRLFKKPIRKNTKSKADDDYGPSALQVETEMTAEIFAQRKDAFLSELYKTSNEIEIIQLETIQQNSSHLWHTERLKRLTASNFGRICRMRATTNRNAAVKNILYSNFSGNEFTKYGVEHESTAIKSFEEKYKVIVKECGLFIDNVDCYLAASPDGIVDNDGLVEVKCPATASKMTPELAIQEKKIKFAEIVNNELHLKNTHPYYYQVQGQLHIANKLFCYFICWTPQGFLVEKIYRDDLFWEEKMKNQLHDFYFNHLLPEIINPKLNK